MRRILTSLFLAAALILGAGKLNIANAWDNWSWSSSVSDINANPVFWTPNAWGGLYFHSSQAVGPSQAASVGFSLQTSAANQKFWAFLYDTNSQQIGSSKLEITSSGDYNLPINSQIGGFVIQEATGVNQPAIQINNVKLVPPATTSTNNNSTTSTTNNIANIFNGSLTSGWINWSWNSQVDFGSVINFRPRGQWAGLYLHSDTGINTAGLNYLSLSAKASQTSQKFQVILYGDNNQTTSTGVALTTDGTAQYIPLDKLNGANRVIKGIVIQDIGTVQDLVQVSNISFTQSAMSNNNLPAPLPVPILVPAAGSGSYTTGANAIFKNGQKINLHGINWFGFETSTNVVHGLWARSYKDVISQMKNLGFNAVRLPFCPASVQGVATTSIDYSKNPDLNGLNSLQVMDKIVNEMSNQGIYTLLDSHRPDCNAQSELWYTGSYSESQWINDLVTLAKRYAGVPNFLGLDLKNEPHGSATWGTGNTGTDWNLAAERAGNAVLSANPNVLLFVEGIGDNPTCQDSNGHFWGGNLSPEKCKALNLPNNKIVYSPHVYGPDVAWQSYFGDGSFPNNMPAVWEAQWGFLTGSFAVAPGEWGGKYGTNGGSPLDVTWENAFASYLKNKGVCSSFYWDLNPNSGDTGGVLQDDWTTPVSSKVNLLQNYFNSCH